jgi:hypothetical protein
MLISKEIIQASGLSEKELVLEGDRACFHYFIPFTETY